VIELEAARLWKGRWIGLQRLVGSSGIEITSESHTNTLCQSIHLIHFGRRVANLTVAQLQ
jgi:hypothetical protein